jgi:hypothetical protein
MQFHSDTPKTLSIGATLLPDLSAILREGMRRTEALERNRCAELVQQLADGVEDQVQRDTLNEVVLAIRRLPENVD